MFCHTGRSAYSALLGSAAAADAWVADWDMSNGLAELRKGNFNNALMFAAYFDKQGKPFSTDDMKKALRNGLAAALGPGQGAYLSIVNDVVEAPTLQAN